MENVFNISWSNTAKIISWATGLLLIGIGYLIITKINELSTWIISAFSIVLLLSVYFVLQAPMSLKLSDDKLTICKLAGIKEIPFSAIEKIEPYKDYHSDIRLMGNGGFLGYTGLFRNKELGKYTAFVGNYNQAFYIRTKSGKIYVTSSEQREEIIRQIQLKL